MVRRLALPVMVVLGAALFLAGSWLDVIQAQEAWDRAFGWQEVVRSEWMTEHETVYLTDALDPGTPEYEAAAADLGAAEARLAAKRRTFEAGAYLAGACLIAAVGLALRNWPVGERTCA